MRSTATVKEPLTPLIPMNNGRVVARVWREASAPDSDGRTQIVEHARTITGRLIDILYEQGQIAPLHYQAGTTLRDSFEKARLSMGQLGRVDGFGKSDSFIRRNEEFWLEYKTAMRQLGQWFAILRHTCIEDRHPAEYGAKYKCHGPGMLKIALDRLVRHYGLDSKR